MRKIVLVLMAFLCLLVLAPPAWSQPSPTPSWGGMILPAPNIFNAVQTPKITTTPALLASILTNGTMTSNISGWSGANWAWNAANGGEALHTAVATTALTGTGSPVVGTSYLVTYTVKFATAGTVTMSFGGLTDTAKSASGVYTYYGTATATTALVFTPTSPFDGAVQLVSLQQAGPALTTCGTGAALQQGSSRMAGKVTPGATISACTITFETAYTNTPACFVQSNTTALTNYVSAASNSAITATFSGNVASFQYFCVGLNE